jgi:hypothetical protein
MVAMLNEQGQDISSADADYGRLVVAVLPHPFHGRLVERVILWVRPYVNLKGERYKLTWWSDGVAYYKPTGATA